MIKIIEVLLAFGMDFNYEHFGSQGEKITCFDLSLEVYNQNGFIGFIYEGETEKLEESDKAFKLFAYKTNEIAEKETASF